MVPAEAGSTGPGALPEAALQGDAAAVLAQLPTKGRAPRTGYERDGFGKRWADIDRNGCDQRNDVLARDLVDETFKPGTHDCVVLTGTLHDAYTGRTIPFLRGNTTSDDVQIDHVVALSNAWQTGAQQLDAATRERLGNDPLNLIATEGKVNQSKGDGDAATWLPPNRAYRCAYVARQVAVKARYGLWVTAAERGAIERILATCPGEPVADDTRALERAG
ncbi:HNH endonuclease family protein [Pseudonocardia sp. TRM90224]|uniref:HNH endonuclease family protein n=1 Tax=Pseudonocardia sp. TRM90224 TaxID=2812678 RepID=UPI001E3E5D11|nr:HNH endonuclease family protein [Pseudonocardia sp. TRM90224]